MRQPGPDPKKCSERMTRGWTYGQCSRKGVVTEDGKLWCKQHAPSNVKARLEASNRRWKEKQNQRARARASVAWYHVIEKLKTDDPELAAKVKEAQSRYGE